MHEALGWAVIAGQPGPAAFPDGTNPHHIRAFVVTQQRLYWVEFADNMLTTVYSAPRPR